MSSESDFRVQQAVLELQQSGWFHQRRVVIANSSQMTDSWPDSDGISTRIRQWMNEIKQQEQTIATTWHNVLNPDQQVIHHIAPVTEVGSDILQGTSNHPVLVASDCTQDACPPMEVSSAMVADGTDQSVSGVVAEIRKSFNLNTGQSWAFEIIMSHFIAKYVEKNEDAHPVAQLAMLMMGPGGTGKTHVVKAVQAVMHHYGCAHLIRFLAPTGSAAALIDGMTVHKGLGLKIKALNKGKGNHQPGDTTEDYSVLISMQNRTQLREEWKNVEYLLIDEVSLLSLQLLAQIDHALRYAKERPDQWFGSVNIIFAGDFYQFPPVGGSALYSPIASYAGQTDAEVQKRLGWLAWKTVDVVITLTEQQRMRDDFEYGNTVNRLRVRKCIEDDVKLTRWRGFVPCRVS
jgi:hypothetical protein